MSIFIDIFEDQKQCKQWSTDKKDQKMLLDDLIDYVIQGHQQCIDFCGSKYSCGDEGCFCIRASFPHPSHYHLYLKLREIGIDFLMLTILANLSKERLPLGLPKLTKEKK